MTPQLEAALAYRKRGWSAIPLRGKKPALATWKQYQTKPMPEAELRARFRAHTNVGVILGTVSGIIGLDIDSQEGVKMLAQWARGLTPGTLPATPAFTTPGGGCRLLYRLPPGLTLHARAFTDEGKKEALRILGEGTQTAMPPSVIEERGYAWIEGLGPDEVPLTFCPAWLITRLTGEVDDQDDQPVVASLGANERARRYLLAMEPCDPRPEHPMDASTHLLKAATALVVGFNLSNDDAVSLLAEWDAGNPCGPYSPKELLRKCQEARKHCNKPAGYLVAGQGETLPVTLPRKKVAAQKPPPAVTTFSALDLASKEFPPMRWAIPNLLPEGGTLLAGRPKSGKSWLVLQLAIAIAQGEAALKCLPVEGGEVLYISLEDGPRRLRSRLVSVLGEDPHAMPGRLHFATEWPRISDGCLDTLAAWLDAHPTTRLVVFDTLTRIRDRRGSQQGGSLYEDDYDLIATLKKLGDERRVCITVVHHTRKPKEQEEDPFDQISGTLGLGGAADCIIVLKRAVAASDAKLHVTGRDVDEQTLCLGWDKESCLWSLLQGQSLTPDQAQVVSVLVTAGRALSAMEVYPRINKNYEATRKLLRRMAQEGLILKNREMYSALPTGEGATHVPVSQSDATHEDDDS